MKGVMGAHTPRPIAERLWAKIEKRGPEECWPWIGHKSPFGYGRIVFHDKYDSAHRIVFAMTNGFWPKVCRHTCDNPPCCNPAHLVDGTQADNLRDMQERGRQVRGEAHGRRKLNAEQVLEIREEVKTKTYYAIAKERGLSHENVRKIALRKSWAHL